MTPFALVTITMRRNGKVFTQNLEFEILADALEILNDHIMELEQLQYHIDAVNIKEVHISDSNY